MRVYPKALSLFDALFLAASLTVWGLLKYHSSLSPSPSTPLAALSSVCKPEFPAVAAGLVRSASPDDKEQTARETLRATALLAKPGVLAYVVSSICGQTPEVAPIAVATAIELQPADINSFIWAAARNAPQQAEQITYAACQSAPGDFDKVAMIVSEAAPTARAGILRGVTNALPDLQPTVEKPILQTGTDEISPVMGQTLLLLTLASQNQEPLNIRR